MRQKEFVDITFETEESANQPRRKFLSINCEIALQQHAHDQVRLTDRFQGNSLYGLFCTATGVHMQLVDYD